MYRILKKKWEKHLDFLILDMLMLHVAYVLAYMFRYPEAAPYADADFVLMAITYTLIDLIVSFYMETYSNVLKRGYWKEFSVTFKQAAAVMLVAAMYLYVGKLGGQYSRIIFGTTAVYYLFFAYCSRILWKKLLQHFAPAEKRKLLIISTSLSAEEVVRKIMDKNMEKLDIMGVVVMDRDMTGERIAGVPVVCAASEVLSYALREWCDEVFIDFTMKEPAYDALLQGFVDMGITVHINLVNITNLAGAKQEVEKLASYMVLTATRRPVTTRQMFIKRMIDIAGGLVGCLITMVLFLFVAPPLLILSPGPVFFKQTRVGRNGKKFELYKFRSMYMDAEERKAELMAQNKVDSGMMFKLDYDPRIIGSEKGRGKGFGNFIRKYSIDEFPQFFNVLKGDMSLVGTRPPTVDEWEKYELHHRARLAAKPGITGLWQVSGRSNILDFEEVVRLDTKYISEWSLGLDLRILLKTVLVVLKREGAM